MRLISTRDGLRCAASVIALAVCGAAGAAQAAADGSPAGEPVNEVGAVVVTAQRREQRLIDVPTSVVAVSGETLRERNIQNAADLSTYIPNFTYTKGGNVNIITIRGVGTAGTDGYESSVGVYVDDVYVPKARNASMPLYDMQRVEVLRGPQGVLFGKNTIAGVLNMVTARPTDTPYFGVDVKAGSYGWVEGSAVASGPINDRLSMRLAAYGGRRDGFIENDTPDRSNGQGFETYGGRLSLDYHPNAAFKLYGKLEYFVDTELGINRQLESIGPADRANPAFAGVESRLDDHQISRTTGIFDVDNTNGPRAWVGELQGVYRFAGGSTLTATLGYNDFDQRISRTDALPINTTLQENPTDIRTTNLEVRFATPIEARLSFIGGLYGEATKVQASGFGGVYSSGIANAIRGQLAAILPASLLPTPDALAASTTALSAGGLSHLHSESFAAFGELRYRLTDKLAVAAGLRYSHDRQWTSVVYAPTDANGLPLASAASIAASLPNPDLILPNGRPLVASIQPIYTSILGLLTTLSTTPPLEKTLDGDAVTPSARIEYKPDASTLIYGTVQTGYKQGGFNDVSSIRSQFGPEHSTGFELGVKKAFSHGLSANLAVFRSSFRDLQVTAVNVARGSQDTFNAASAVSQGVELDASWRINEAWSLAASYAYLDAHYDSFPNGSCSIDRTIAIPTGCVEDFSGRPLFNAPKNSASLQVDYQRPLGTLTAGFSLVGAYKSRYYTEITDSGELAADETMQVDGRVFIGSGDRRWRFEVAVSNIFDDRMATLRQRPALVADPRTWTATINKPRMAYAALSYRF